MTMLLVLLLNNLHIILFNEGWIIKKVLTCKLHFLKRVAKVCVMKILCEGKVKFYGKGSIEAEVALIIVNISMSNGDDTLTWSNLRIIKYK